MTDSPLPKGSSRSVLLGVLIAVFALYYIYSLLIPWPPDWVERRTQRRDVIGRVQAAGGWTAIQRDCDVLVERYHDSQFFWSRGEDTNALPPSLAALMPWQIRFDSPILLRQVKDAPQVAVVRIKLFGMHSTGGHSMPYFGLEIVSGSGAKSYRPSATVDVVPGNEHHSYSRVTDTIYEVY